MANVNENALLAELAKLKAENEALKAKAQARLTLKVSVKGAVSLYGLGQFPVTLYPTQWLKVLDMGKDIRETCDNLIANPDILERLKGAAIESAKAKAAAKAQASA
jgi:hypothetical protein